MKYAIVYESVTGNTKQLADHLAATLEPRDCVVYAPVSDVSLDTVANAQRIYVGFWTNKGDCTSEVAAFLQKLDNKEIFLFGTAGFGTDPTYLAGVVARVSRHLPDTATVVGSFMCPGRMPASVRERYVRTRDENPAQADRMRQMIDNFDASADRPNDTDAEELIKKVLDL